MLKESQDTYIVKNETKHSIDIYAFDVFIYSAIDEQKRRITPRSEKPIHIKPFEEYSIIKLTGEGSMLPGLFSNTDVDSVSIKFDNTRIITFKCPRTPITCTDTDRNILLFNDTFEHTSIKDGVTERIYTITEEDYNNAVPIEE